MFKPIYNVANMSSNAICENIIFVKISKFTVAQSAYAVSVKISCAGPN